eukprot:14952869-Alexandrium_andersonii.AAC.1
MNYDFIATAALVAASTPASPRCLSGHGCTWRGAVLPIVCVGPLDVTRLLSLIHISEPTRLALI